MIDNKQKGEGNEMSRGTRKESDTRSRKCEMKKKNQNMS